MIEDAQYKEILEDDYRQLRKRADALRSRGEYENAARLYEKCADIITDLANVESRQSKRSAWRELAENLRNGASKLKTMDAGQLQDTASDPPVSGSSLEDDDEADGDSGGAGTNPPERSETENERADFVTESPNIDFDDVGGMTELKQTLIDKVVDPLERRELHEKYDLGVANAILLHGPPGTGKTYIARALAGKVDYDFIQVHADTILSKYIGESAKNLAALFETARSNQPCLVFLDEIDALAPSRSGGHQNQSQRQMVDQLLTEMSAVKGEDVVLIAATNIPEEVDDAALNRFEDKIEVPKPDSDARVAILRVHLRERPVVTEEINWDRIKEFTEGYSARELESAAADAARKALKEARANDGIEPITQEHLESAIEENEPGLG